MNALSAVVNRLVWLTIFYALFVLAVAAQQQAATPDVFETLYLDFKSAAKAPCGQRQKAYLAGRKLIEYFDDDPHFLKFERFVQRRMATMRLEDEKCAGKVDEQVEALFAWWTKKDKTACGNREAMIKTTKDLLASAESRTIDSEIIAYFKLEIPLIEEEERKCRLSARYDETYRAKKWPEFFAASRELLGDESNSEKRLDILLTMVSAGYDYALPQKDQAVARETVELAKQAIRQIQAGQISQSWGVHQTFKNKDDALGWMHFIAGLLSLRLPDKQPDAPTLIYRATQFKGELQTDPMPYLTLGKWYSDRAVVLSNERLTQIKAGDDIRAEQTLALAKGYAERALDAYWRALKLTAPAERPTLRKDIDVILRFRLGAPSEAEISGAEEYLDELTKKPLPDPLTEVKPLRKKPQGIIIIGKSL